MDKRKNPKKNQNKDEPLAEAKNYLRRLLEYRPRSQSEVEDRLTKKSFSDEIVYETIDWATEKGLIDDELFANFWINERLENKPKGSSGIYKELLEKGISKKTIQKALDEKYPNSEERKLCKSLAEKRVERYSGEDTKKKYRKTLNFLTRRGFNKGMAHKVLKELLFD